MKRIIIPTDFTVHSLELVEYAVLNYPETKLEIVLIAGFRLPETRWAISHFNQNGQIREQLSSSFSEAKCRILLEHKNTISSISIELFTGINSYVFKQYLKQIDVEDAIVPTKSTLHYPNKNWFDPTNFIKKNVNNVIEIALDPTKEAGEKRFSLSNLLSFSSSHN